MDTRLIDALSLEELILFKSQVKHLARHYDLIQAVRKKESLTRNEYLLVLDKLSFWYHNAIPVITDAEYDRVLDFFQTKYGKYGKVGSLPI